MEMGDEASQPGNKFHLPAPLKTPGSHPLCKKLLHSLVFPEVEKPETASVISKLCWRVSYCELMITCFFCVSHLQHNAWTVANALLVYWEFVWFKMRSHVTMQLRAATKEKHVRTSLQHLKYTVNTRQRWPLTTAYRELYNTSYEVRT